MYRGIAGTPNVYDGGGIRWGWLRHELALRLILLTIFSACLLSARAALTVSELKYGIMESHRTGCSVSRY
jgi:hypothetical protein